MVGLVAMEARTGGDAVCYLRLRIRSEQARQAAAAAIQATTDAEQQVDVWRGLAAAGSELPSAPVVTVGMAASLTATRTALGVARTRRTDAETTALAVTTAETRYTLSAAASQEAATPHLVVGISINELALGPTIAGRVDRRMVVWLLLLVPGRRLSPMLPGATRQKFRWRHDGDDRGRAPPLEHTIGNNQDADAAIGQFSTHESLTNNRVLAPRDTASHGPA